MAPEMIGLLGIIVLMILLALKMWVGAAMTLVSVIGIILLKNVDVAWMAAGSSAAARMVSPEAPAITSSGPSGVSLQ